MRLRFSANEEGRLLLRFIAARGERGIDIQMLHFCQQYRNLGLGSSFLNDAHTTRWLADWRDRGALDRDLGSTRRLLNAIRDWVGLLFREQVLDGDAFYYLDIGRFLRGKALPIHLDVNLQSSIRTHLSALALDERYQSTTLRIYQAVLLDFNRFQAEWPGAQPGTWSGLESEALLIAWIQSQRLKVDVRNASGRLGVVRTFLEFLKTRGRLAINPVDTLRERYPRHGLRGLAAALGSDASHPALQRLLPEPRFSGPWGPRMVEFIRLKRSLGAGYLFEERTLAQLDRYLARAGLAEVATVAPAAIHGWLESLPGVSPATRATKRRVAEAFFEHMIRRGLLADNPARFRCGGPPQRTHAFIFTREQIQEVLRRASGLRDVPFFAHRGATYATIFATLYCLGLRVSEVCALSLGDIDLSQGLVLVRESKFYKSRLLPMGPRYCESLEQFLDLRRRGWPDASRAETPLFPGRYWRRLHRCSIGGVLRAIIKEIGLRPGPGQRGPCVHSFRHSFALHRLTRWYREGADVQAKLPLLSAFLGHLDIASTQVYLDATTDLLEAANERFEASFGQQWLRPDKEVPR